VAQKELQKAAELKKRKQREIREISRKAWSGRKRENIAQEKRRKQFWGFTACQAENLGGLEVK
jgi:hypothetical protein